MAKTKKINSAIKVQMVDTGKVNIRFTQEIQNFTRLGKEIKVSPKSHSCINKAGFKAEYFTDTVSVNIGIGNHHTAELIMTVDAWKALKKGEKVFTTTTEEFKKKFG